MDEPQPDLRPQADRVREYFAGTVGQDRYFEFLHYTERLQRSMHWCVSTDDDSMPGGVQACDLVNETVKSLLQEDSDGRRILPADVSVALGLKMIVKSKISHAAGSFENAHRSDHEDVDNQGKSTDHLETDALMWEPREAKLSPQQQASIAARCVGFMEFCRKDQIVYGMLVVIRDLGIDEPAERLARELGIKVAEVYIARKRLGTLLRKFKKRNAP